MMIKKGATKMKHRNVYTVAYRNWVNGEVKTVQVIACSKAEAYDLAAYETIPHKEGEHPYSVWVDNVTYSNGNVRYFNTSEGNAY